MKILFVCHRLPYPPSRGGKIRPFNVVRHLAASGHEITVASLARSAEELRAGEGLRDYCRKVVAVALPALTTSLRTAASIVGSSPASMKYFYSPALARDIRAELATGRYDFVMVHCSSVADYVAGAREMPKLLDFGDMDSQKWLDYARWRRQPAASIYWLEGAKLARAEKRLAGHFDLCTCTTRNELETLRGLAAGVETGWFPNGVDSKFFDVGTARYEPSTICFVGRMDYYPNQQAVLQFCEQVLPALRADFPALKFQIVGAEPPAAIRRLGALPGVTVTGSVPDVRSYVQSSALTVAPLAIARGTQNKILESMAMGVPVVSSVEASKGVDARPGVDLAVAATPNEFKEAIKRILADPAERTRLALAGRSRVLEKHSWDASMTLLDELIEKCKRAHATH
jgi:sugar transferase (PEP-CTERM/EpsH1 system associated)